MTTRRPSRVAAFAARDVCSRPQVDPRLSGRLSKGTISAGQRQRSPLREFQIRSAVERQMVQGRQLRQPRQRQ